MKFKKTFINLISYLGVFCTLPIWGVLALIFFKRMDFFIISIITFLLLILRFINNKNVIHK